MAKLTKNLAPLFDSSISYEPGERFMYGDHMYEALEPLSGAFDSTKVSEVTLADIFKGIASNDVKCLAPIYDESTEYYADNLVLYDGVLYECLDSTTGPFDETKWTRKYLSDVGELNSNLSCDPEILFGNNKYTLFPGNDTTKNAISVTSEKKLYVEFYAKSANGVKDLIINFYNEDGSLLKTETVGASIDTNYKHSDTFDIPIGTTKITGTSPFSNTAYATCVLLMVY